MNNFILFNGQFLPDNTPLITSQNRGFRYGDGLFETLRVINNQVLFSDLHMERLFSGLNLLRFDLSPHFSPEFLLNKISGLAQKNKQENRARIRLNVFRGNGGLYDPENNQPNYCIESWPLDMHTDKWNEHGLSAGVFTSGKKSMDQFSNLKSNSALLYVVAAQDAKAAKLNDHLILNTAGRICESTMANVFLVKQQQVLTPPLSEGCVAGILRRALLEYLPTEGFIVQEKPITMDELFSADEVFLTNAIRPLRWIGEINGKTFGHTVSREISEILAQNISFSG